MNRDWKAGDILLCVDARNCLTKESLIEGKEYIIASVKDCCGKGRIQLRGHAIDGWRCLFCNDWSFGPASCWKHRFIKIGELRPIVGRTSAEDINYGRRIQNHTIESSNSSIQG